MRNLNVAWKVSVLGLVLAGLASVSGATAIPVRGASHYGNSTYSFSDCESGNTAVIDDLGDKEACEAFNLTPTAVTFDGLNYNVYEFVTGGNTAAQLYNVIALGSVGPNATFSLPADFFDPATTELFVCDNQQSAFNPVDSVGNPMMGPCTQGLTTNPGISVNADGSFTTSANFNVFNLVLDSKVPVVSTPEPGSMAMLGVGLLALWGGKKKLLTRT